MWSKHFSQHTGQIILLTKMLTGTDLAYYLVARRVQSFREAGCFSHPFMA
jgi:hypothetical protein